MIQFLACWLFWFRSEADAAAPEATPADGPHSIIVYTHFYGETE